MGKSKDEYYSLDKILDKNTCCTIIIGGRAIGRKYAHLQKMLEYYSKIDKEVIHDKIKI